MRYFDTRVHALLVLVHVVIGRFQTRRMCLHVPKERKENAAATVSIYVRRQYKLLREKVF